MISLATHRARAANWSLEEVAYYLGHVTMKGTLAIQTTMRYTGKSSTCQRKAQAFLRVSMFFISSQSIWCTDASSHIVTFSMKLRSVPLDIAAILIYTLFID